MSSDFGVRGVTHNNLKNIDFSARLGEIVVVCGASGSGKSSLVHEVIVAEARRQAAMRRKTDDIYTYAVRPEMKSATALPDVESVTQRALPQTEASSFGTRTGLKSLLKRMFVHHGEIFHEGQQIRQPTLDEIRNFSQSHHPGAKLYAIYSNYDAVDGKTAASLLQKQGVTSVVCRDEIKSTSRLIAVSKLGSIKLENYQILIDIADNKDHQSIAKLARQGILLVGEGMELNFNEHWFSLVDGKIFRKPSPLLFSRSTASSLSGCCSACAGKGSRLSVNLDGALDKDSRIDQGFLRVPLSKSGRYVGFKFLPSGLTKVLKSQGVDVSQSFAALTTASKKIVIDTLTEKLIANRADQHAQSYLSDMPCPDCKGTGFGYQARAVLLSGKPFHYYLGLPAADLAKILEKLNTGCVARDEALTKLQFIHKLAIDHIALDRSTASLSSGEAQRLKLLDVLVSQERDRIIVLDEPSSNLQYRDNINIIEILMELKSRNNCVLVVDHNPVYQFTADRVLEIGPGAGKEGGRVLKKGLPSSDPLFAYPALDFVAKGESSPKTKKIKLRPRHNLQLPDIAFPLRQMTVVVGSSGSGKTTLMDLICQSLEESGEQVVRLTAKAPGRSPASIVATYIDVFDDIRKVYAKSSAPLLTESDFSFNAAGACPQCGGSGIDEGIACGVCFGSRYRADVSLVKVDGKSIVELLNTDIPNIGFQSSFGFLSHVKDVFDALALSHLSLGRALSSLSGGEIQRLKLVKFILGYWQALSRQNTYVILDEPCRGLDRKSIEKLHRALGDYLKGCTVLAVEHNPDFIYRCGYVIDLGGAKPLKTSSDVVAGAAGSKSFPSLNHRDVFQQVRALASQRQNKTPSQLPCRDNASAAPNSQRDTERYRFLRPVFIRQDNFALEKRFAENFQLCVPDDDVVFYRSRDALQAAVATKEKFFFNPFVSHLEKYHRVPLSVRKQVAAGLKSIRELSNAEPWSALVEARSFDEAFFKGGGVVATASNCEAVPEEYTYHAIRLFSRTARVVDGIHPFSFAFNLYRNACPYCKGYAHLKSFPFSKWLDKSFSVLDPRCMPLKLGTVLPKTAIAKFAKEELFDFSKPVHGLTDGEFNILLYGFKPYKFLKEGKKGDVESDFFEWRGLNSYIYNNMGKLSPKKDISDELAWTPCPFCESGFRQSVRWYKVKGELISDCLL